MAQTDTHPRTLRSGHPTHSIFLNALHSLPRFDLLYTYHTLATHNIPTRISRAGRLHGWFPHNASCAFKRITALVKLAFVPVVNPNDLVLIENEDALCHMIQSIRYREAGNAGAATQFELDAFRELNYQLRDRFPIEQLTIDFRPFGTADLNRVTGGFY